MLFVVLRRLPMRQTYRGQCGDKTGTVLESVAFSSLASGLVGSLCTNVRG